MLKSGINGLSQATVNAPASARAIGSGELDVLATPKLAALVEEAAWRSVAAELDEGQSSVGTKLVLEHLAPTPLGMTVSCATTLMAVEGRRLMFAFEAHDDAGLVARGTHERVVVDAERFLAKAAGRADA